jgi:hypothetical protein
VGAPVVQTGYYDGHKDTFIDTDVTSKAQARQTGANYAPTLGALKISALPSFFMIRGPAAPGQLTVLGSEPGEADYSPIWREIMVRWKPGAKKVLLVKDDQISALAAKGALTATPTNIAMNCPVTSVGS